jgi:hypothetical protein
MTRLRLRSRSCTEGPEIQGEASPAYARRKLALSNPEVRRSLERAESWILAHPNETRWRHERSDGTVVDRHEPGLLIAFEPTDSETFTWIDWFDLWSRH